MEKVGGRRWLALRAAAGMLTRTEVLDAARASPSWLPRSQIEQRRAAKCA